MSSPSLRYFSGTVSGSVRIALKAIICRFLILVRFLVHLMWKITPGGTGCKEVEYRLNNEGPLAGICKGLVSHAYCCYNYNEIY